MDYVRPLINNPVVIEQAARKHNVHASLIYFLFQLEMAAAGKKFWGAFRDQFPDVQGLTAKLNAASWSDESIASLVAKIKASLQLP